MGNNVKDFIKLKDELKIFHLLDDEEIEKLAHYFEKITFPAGTVLFKEGETADFFGFVVSGKLEVKKETEFEEKQIVLAILEKGAIVGELSLIGINTRTATTVALQDSELFTISNEQLEQFIQKYPYTGIKILKGLIRVMSLRFRKTVERLTTVF